MATGDYCTLPELKRDSWPDGEDPDNENDIKLASVITAVSREIDAYCGTSFYDPGADEARYYTSHDGQSVRIDPATTVTSLATDDELDRTYSTSWTATTDYETWPYNANAFRGIPITRIDRSPLSSYSFPKTPRSVKVTARYCYQASASPTATLADIKQVALMKCIRMFKRKDAPFGTMGPEGEVIYSPGFTIDEIRILNNYRVNYT